jgi:hypothetical protein
MPKFFSPFFVVASPPLLSACNKERRKREVPVIAEGGEGGAKK